MSEVQSHTHSLFSAINLACGGKLCSLPGWINADHSPSAREVMKINLLKRLPFQDNSFDLVYHSQFMEHLPIDRGHAFLQECYRVLKPGGVLRVVTPDLENQAAEYLRNLQDVIDDPENEETRLRYSWIRLEMLDQLTRNASGGDMVGFLSVSGAKIRDYLCQRMGRSGENMIPCAESRENGGAVRVLLAAVKRGVFHLVESMAPAPVTVGKFRLSGESHLCMYDRYLLAALLAKAGFAEIAKVGAKESRIPGFDQTLLDCDLQGRPDCQVSLFMEAVKPAR